MEIETKIRGAGLRTVESSRVARRQFKAAVNAHKRALERATATLLALSDAQKVLYDEYINISEEFECMGIGFQETKWLVENPRRFE